MGRKIFKEKNSNAVIAQVRGSVGVSGGLGSPGGGPMGTDVVQPPTA